MDKQQTYEILPDLVLNFEEVSLVTLNKEYPNIIV